MLFPQNQYDQVVPDHIIEIAEGLPVRGRNRFIQRLQQLAFENARDFLRDPERFIKTAIATVYGAGYATSSAVNKLLSKKQTDIVEFTVDSEGASKRTKFETPDRPAKKADPAQSLDTDTKRKPPKTQPPTMVKKMDIDNEGTTAIDNPLTLTSANAKGATQSSAKGKSGGNGETPISPYDFVQIGLPKTYTTKLPYNGKGILNWTTDICVPLAWRTNSIYDVRFQNSLNPTSDAAVTADAVDAVINLPKWRSYFADKYQYWTVLGCDYNVKFRLNWNGNSNGSGKQLLRDFHVFMYKCGLQLPPTTNAAGTAAVPKEWKLLHTGVEMKTLPGLRKKLTYNAAGTTLNAVELMEGPGEWISFQGWCGRNSYKHNVVEDELEQTWHKMTEVPPTPERLVFHIQPDDRWAQDFNPMTIEYEVDLTYLVQFKDLQFKYEFPTQETGFATIGSIQGAFET